MATAALILPLVFIIYEDLSFRAIHWAWVVLLFLLALWLVPWQYSHLLINGLLVLLQLALLTLYFSLKQGEIVNIVNHYLGLGDILFFLPLCILFSPGNFISFFILSLMFSLIAHLVYRSFHREKKTTIPLAAYMSLALIAVLISSQIWNFDLHSDQLIINALKTK